MASNLVDHISFQVKKLIVGLSPSRKERAPQDALVTITTVPVCKMLFGAPTQIESYAWLATAAVKKEPINKNEEAISLVMENATRGEGALQDGLVTTTTVPVRNVLFGVPIQIESDAWLATAAVIKESIDKKEKQSVL
jgi:hypothetical protein